jgi:hypothetical protein
MKKKKASKKMQDEKRAAAETSLPANLIEGPFLSKKKKCKPDGKPDGKPDSDGHASASGHEQVAWDESQEEFCGEEEPEDVWEDVPEHELAGLLCRSALNRLLPVNIDTICHDLMHNQSISQSITVLAIVDTIVTQVLRTRLHPFGTAASPLNAAAVSSLGVCALFASRFSRMAPTLHLPPSRSIFPLKSAGARFMRARTAPGCAAGVADDETTTAGVLLEQALMRALMDLLDRVDCLEEEGRTATGVGDEPCFSEIAEPAFCVSYFIARLHAHGVFRTATLHVVLTMLIDSNENCLGGTGAPFELWLGSLMLEHVRNMDVLIHGGRSAAPATPATPGARAVSTKKTKSKAQIDAATAAVAHYFAVLSRAKDEATWRPARFEMQRVLSHHSVDGDHEA